MGSDEKAAWEKKLDAAISDLRQAQETMAKTASDEFPDHDDWMGCSEQMEHYSGRARRRLRELRPMIRADRFEEGAIRTVLNEHRMAEDWSLPKRLEEYLTSELAALNKLNSENEQWAFEKMEETFGDEARPIHPPESQEEYERQSEWEDLHEAWKILRSREEGSV